METRVCLFCLCHFFYRLCGFDSAFTVETIKDDDIDSLNEYGRQIFQEIESKSKTLSIAQKKAIVGSYYNDPQNFQIEKGERIMLQKVVKYTASKIETTGYSYFATETASGPIDDQSNAFYLEAKGKHIFIENCSNLVNGVSQSVGVVDVKRKVPENRLKKSTVARKQCHQECHPTNIVPLADLSPDLPSSSESSSLKKILNDRLSKFFHDTNLPIVENIIKKCRIYQLI